MKNINDTTQKTETPTLESMKTVLDKLDKISDAKCRKKKIIINLNRK